LGLSPDVVLPYDEQIVGFLGERVDTRSYVYLVEPSGVQTLKNPNPLKDVEGLDVLVVAELS